MINLHTLAPVTVIMSVIIVTCAQDHATRAARHARYAEAGGITAELDGACMRNADALPTREARTAARVACCEAREGRVPAIFRVACR